MTDAERSATYRVENQLIRLLTDPDNPNAFVIADVVGSRIVLPMARRFGDLDGVQRYVDAVLAMDQIRPLNKGGRVVVRRRKGTTKAHYERWGVIAIPDHGSRWAMNELVVLHEIAHHLDNRPGHGPTFRGHLVNLLSAAMAPEVGLYMASGFDQQDLSIKLP